MDDKSLSRGTGRIIEALAWNKQTTILFIFYWTEQVPWSRAAPMGEGIALSFN